MSQDTPVEIPQEGTTPQDNTNPVNKTTHSIDNPTPNVNGIEDTPQLEAIIRQHMTYSDGFNAYELGEDELPRFEAALIQWANKRAEARVATMHRHIFKDCKGCEELATPTSESEDV